MKATEHEGPRSPETLHERAAREADREAARIRPYLEAGKIPPGYEVYTREQIASGEWLS